VHNGQPEPRLTLFGPWESPRGNWRAGRQREREDARRCFNTSIAFARRAQQAHPRRYTRSHRVGV